MDERELGGLFEGLPSPEELFHADEREEYGQTKEQKQEAAKEEQKQAGEVQEKGLKEDAAPKGKKAYSAGIMIALLILALILTNLDFFHIHLFCMRSESMGDVIPKGSVVISYETPAEELGPGDVITYMNGDGVLITHEIINVIDNYEGRGCYAFRTKGTANAAEDEETVTYGMIRGKAFRYVPYIGLPFVQ